MDDYDRGVEVGICYMLNLLSVQRCCVESSVNEGIFAHVCVFVYMCVIVCGCCVWVLCVGVGARWCAVV